MSVFSAGDFYVTSALPTTSEQTDYSGVDDWFDLMLYDLSSNDIEVFQNATALKQSATHVFQGIAAQWVGPWLSFPDNLSTSSSYAFEEDRLHVQRQATWEMCAGLAAVTMIGLALLFVSIKGPKPKIPSTLSALAVILTSNSSFEQSFRGAGHLTDEKLRNHLKSTLFSIDGVRVESPVHEPKETSVIIPQLETDSLTPDSPAHQFWTPMSSARWFVALCVVLPICELIALEVLQRQSDQHEGFCDITTSPELSHQLITVLSALIMISTAAMFSATEWASGVFAPFHLLRRQACKLRQVDRNKFGGLAPVVLVRAVRDRQFAASAMLLSTIIGSMLTIAVSGLFTIVASSKSSDVTAYTTGQFDTAWNSTADLAATNTFTLIYSHNASDPEGSHREIAFPSIRLDQTNEHLIRILASKNSTDSVVDVHVPVLRGLLNCSMVVKEDMSYGIKAAKYSASYAVSPSPNVNATYDLPERCKYSSGQYQNSSQILATYSSSVPLVASGSWIDGQIMDVTGVGALPQLEHYYSWPQYCPSLAFIVGQFANDTSTDDKTVIVCTQLQEELPARVRLSIPNLSFDAGTPIEIDESQAKVVTGYQYHFADMFNYGSETSSFYETLANITGVQLEELIGDENVQTMINATQHLYRLYMAQVFNSAMRLTSLTSNTTTALVGTLPINSTIKATIFDPTGLRIVQNNKAKIILQSFLVVMVVCYIAAYAMIDMRKTLPHNPCSIAGTMSLLAGSRFAEEVASVAQDTGDLDEPGRRLANSQLQLGWYANKGDQDSRFGIEIVD